MFRFRLFLAIVIAAGLFTIAPASAAVSGVPINPGWLSLRLAAAHDPALLYTFPRQVVPGARNVVGGMFSSPLALAAGDFENVLHTFSSTDGDTPNSLIRDATGALYGTTTFGGNTFCQIPAVGCGTVFKLTPPAHGSGAWTRTTLYSFTGLADGGYPSGALIADANGALYGTTFNGGVLTGACGENPGCGTVFKLTPPQSGHGAWTERVLHAFTYDTDGMFPTGALTPFGGALFAETASGGRSCRRRRHRGANAAAGRVEDLERTGDPFVRRAW